MPSHAGTFGLVIVEALGQSVIARDIFEFGRYWGFCPLFLRCWRAQDLLTDVQPSDAVQRARASTEGYDITLIAKRHQELCKELIEG